MARKIENRPKQKLVGKNRHHLLFQHRYWGIDPYSHYLRGYFIFILDIEDHNNLHSVVQNVPVPPHDMLVHAVQDYDANQATIANLNILEAIEWLMAEMPYRPFVEAMQAQYDFFSRELGR